MGEDRPCEINTRGGLGSLNCWKQVGPVGINVESGSIDADFGRVERPAEFIVEPQRSGIEFTGATSKETHDPGNTVPCHGCDPVNIPLCAITYDPPSSSLVRTNYFMSHSQPTASSSSNFQLIINNALDKYKKRTKNDLLAHPLAAQIQTCNSPGAILAVLQQQVHGLGQSRSGDERWSRWLDPTVNVLYALSSTVAAGVGLVCLSTSTL